MHPCPEAWQQEVQLTASVPCCREVQLNASVPRNSLYRRSLRPREVQLNASVPLEGGIKCIPLVPDVASGAT